jgi:hypothetical protein
VAVGSVGNVDVAAVGSLGRGYTAAVVDNSIDLVEDRRHSGSREDKHIVRSVTGVVEVDIAADFAGKPDVHQQKPLQTSERRGVVAGGESEHSRCVAAEVS